MGRYTRARKYACAHSTCEHEATILWRATLAEEEGLRAHNCCQRHTHVLHVHVGVRLPVPNEPIHVRILPATSPGIEPLYSSTYKRKIRAEREHAIDCGTHEGYMCTCHDREQPTWMQAQPQQDRGEQENHDTH